MCAQVAPSAEYLRGYGRVAVDVTALRRLWQHLAVLGQLLFWPTCQSVLPAWQLVVVAVCQLLNKDYNNNYYYYLVIIHLSSFEQKLFSCL